MSSKVLSFFFSHWLSRSNLPFRKLGMPTVFPVYAPFANSGIGAMICSIPSKATIGFVINSIVAVITKSSSPSLRCFSISCWPFFKIFGLIRSDINLSRCFFKTSMSIFFRGSQENTKYSFMLS